VELNLNIKTKHNLLAFSAGIDSTALFFLLEQNHIPFDIIMVNYGLRAQSSDEVNYAKYLSEKFKKRLFIENYPKDRKFNQKLGRDFRYNFFDKICKESNYQTIITAHQLNDKLEWFMMQLSKGAGLLELMSMQKSYKKDGIYHLKPLLDISKKELLDYLENKNIRYFIDISNKDIKYKRNYIRENFTDDFLKLYQDGIKNSFKYLENDLSLLTNFETKVEKQQQLTIIKYNHINIQQIIWLIDKELKSRGLIISFKTKELLKTENELVISHKFAVVYDKKILWIAPYSKTVIPKNIKEIYRVQKYPKLIRPYLYDINFDKII